MDYETWEGIASYALDAVGLTAPINPAEVAALCGLRLVPCAGSGGAVSEKELFYPRNASIEDQARVIAHETGHWLLRHCREPDSEEGADHVGRALLLPRDSFALDIRQYGLDLYALQSLNAFADLEIIARRICDLRETWGEVWDHKRRREIFLSRMLRDRPILPSSEPLVREALESMAPVRGKVSAWPTIRGARRRIIVMSERWFGDDY